MPLIPWAAERVIPMMPVGAMGEIPPAAEPRTVNGAKRTGEMPVSAANAIAIGIVSAMTGIVPGPIAARNVVMR